MTPSTLSQLSPLSWALDFAFSTLFIKIIICKPMCVACVISFILRIKQINGSNEWDWWISVLNSTWLYGWGIVHAWNICVCVCCLYAPDIPAQQDTFVYIWVHLSTAQLWNMHRRHTHKCVQNSKAYKILWHLMATIFMTRMLMVRLSMRLVLEQRAEEFIRHTIWCRSSYSPRIACCRLSFV